MLDMEVGHPVVDCKPARDEPFVVQFGVSHISARANGTSFHDEGFLLVLGTCARNPHNGRFVHWAKAVLDHFMINNVHEWDPKGHDCDFDHIMTWPNLSKTFGYPSHMIRLSFIPCQFAPQQTLVLHIGLEGNAHAEIQRRANVWIPPLSALPAPPLPDGHLLHE